MLDHVQRNHYRRGRLMPGVYREADIAFGDEVYTFSPNIRFLRALEGELAGFNSSIAAISANALKGNPQISLMSLLIARVLQAAGAEPDEDQLYADLMGNEDAARELYFTCINLMMPTPKEAPSPNPEAPDE